VPIIQTTASSPAASWAPSSPSKSLPVKFCLL
jgi:hypothetical protein